MTTADRVALLLVCLGLAYVFLVRAAKNRRNQFIGDFLEGLAEDEALSVLL